MRFSKTQRTILHRSIAALLAMPTMTTGVAYAQSTSDQAATGGTEQIVVTARRREELLQDVPGSVSVFSGASLEKAGIPDITGLADLIPNTTLKASRATNSTLTAFIRGIGQQDPVAGYQQGVGIYLDDVYMARPQGALADIYDLDRIEVLRGPQGTLYGRNTIGGAVKYVTRKLPAKTEMSVKATYGEYNERDLVVKASAPLSDTFRIGASFASFDRDGFGKNVVNGNDNYNKDVKAGRVSIEMMPTSSLFIRLAADRTIDDSLPKQGYRLTAGPAPTNEPVLGGYYDTRANLYKVLGQDQEVVSHGESLLIDYQINPTLSFKSITASRGSESFAPIDFDSLSTALFEAPAIYNDEQTSQEFQLTYTGEKLQGVAGVFYMKSNAFNEFDVLYNALGGLSLYTRDNIDSKTWAVYADANYKISDAFDVNLGLRYTEDTVRAAIYKRTYFGLAGSPTLGNPAAVGSPVVNTDMTATDLNRTDNKLTPKIGFGWKLAPGQNVYGSYSEGFKGGMFDPRMDLGGVPGSATSLIKRKGVEPEQVSTYELGLKSSFNGGRIQTNAAVFFTDYNNVQIPGSIPTFAADGVTVTGFAGSLTNAGKAKINGLELEVVARLTDSFSVSGMYSHIDAKYKEWIISNGLAGAALALVNVAGSAEFQNTPKNAANLTATYEWPVAMFGKSGSLALSNSVSYKSKVYQSEAARTSGIASWDGAGNINVTQANMLAQDAYTLWDAGLVWSSSDRKTQVALNGRNLTDKRYKVAGYPFAGFFNTITAFYGDPRTVKLTVSQKF
ncbi:MAG: TonB-dependent receptor [Rhodocyclaceae bacterium]|nr:TonB-dependent receptor [Rhodocyclaceae bacterium]